MQLKVAPWRIIRIYIVMGLIMLAAFYSIAGWIWPPTTNHYLALGAALVLTGIFLWLALTKNYYVLENNGIHHYNFKSEYFYDYKNIIYVDQGYSMKHKIMKFYLTDGNPRLLTFDQTGEIYTAVLKNSPNLLSEADFRKRYPKK